MAGKSPTLSIKIVSDASKAGQGFADAESKVAGFERGLDRASVAATGVLAGIGLIAKGAFDAASALQQSTGAIDSVFGDWAIDIEQAAQKGAQAVGLATSDYENAAALIGSQLKSLGFETGDNVAKTQELIGVGADLAATFGGTTEDAVAALSSALKGERDPIERYGISLSQAAIDAKVAALGLDTSTDAATRNAGAVATLAIIQEQGSSAMGAFARESDTAAGAQARAAAEFENAQAALGQVLLPIVAAAATKFSELTAFLVENQAVVIPLIAVIAGMAAAVLTVNAAMTVYRTVMAIATAAQWLFNFAMAANPLGIVVLVIAAVIAGVILMYNKFEWFRNFISGVGSVLGTVFDGLRAGVQWIIDKLTWISNTAGSVMSALNPFNAPAPAAEGDGAMGVFGAAEGAPALRGASMGSLGGGTSPSAAQGSAAGMVVNVTINGAVDPVATGRQLEQILRDYGRATGRQVALQMSR